MKKIVLLLAVLLMAMPAMAALNVTCSAVGDVVTVSYADGGGKGGVRAFALDVTLSDGAVISNVTRLSTDFYVSPGSVSISGTTINGNIVAASTYPGTLGGSGTSGMTIEMGSLYVGDPNAPATSGDLFSFKVDMPCTVTIATNAIRGDIVMENPATPSGLSGTLSTCSLAYATGCKYDGDNDGYIIIDDLNYIVAALVPTAPDYYIDNTNSLYLAVYDYDDDGYITIDDLNAIVALLVPTSPNFYIGLWTCP